jgi:DNA polymerase III subunit delta
VKLSGDKLGASLARGLGTAYLVSGDEPLLVGEACDDIRRAAREAGYTDRELHFADRGFDWQAVRVSSRTLSLFAERRIVEIRLSGSSPGPEPGPGVLAELASAGDPDTLLLVVATRLDARSLGTRWCEAFDRNGAIVQVWPVDGAHLPAWLVTRGRRLGLELDPQAAALLAERIEGNLLAAQQELEKLALAHPHGTLGAAEVLEAVASSARFDVLQLGEAAMSGNARRALRILAGLRAEGQEATLTLWALNKDLQWLARVVHLVGGGQSVDTAMAAERVWRPRQAAMKRALARLDAAAIESLIGDAARVDRAIKGALRRDPWLELEALTARFAGIELARVA